MWMKENVGETSLAFFIYLFFDFAQVMCMWTKSEIDRQTDPKLLFDNIIDWRISMSDFSFKLCKKNIFEISDTCFEMSKKLIKFE